MEPDAHRSFNFNKLRSFLISRVASSVMQRQRYARGSCETKAVTGVELDSDQFVGPGVDYMPAALAWLHVGIALDLVRVRFEMTEKESHKQSPLLTVPIKLLRPDPLAVSSRWPVVLRQEITQDTPLPILPVHFYSFTQAWPPTVTKR